MPGPASDTPRAGGAQPALAANLLRSGGEHGCALDGFRGIAPVASPLALGRDGAAIAVDPFLCGLAFAPTTTTGAHRVEIALDPPNAPGIAVERTAGGLALRIDHRRFRGAVGVSVRLAEPGAPAAGPDAPNTLRLRLEAAPGPADARSLHGFDPAWDRLLRP